MVWLVAMCVGGGWDIVREKINSCQELVAVV